MNREKSDTEPLEGQGEDIELIFDDLLKNFSSEEALSEALNSSPTLLEKLGSSIPALKRLLNKKRKRDREIITIGDDKPLGKRKRSFLGEDTKSLGRKRRIIEQNGHRKLARVHAREHPDESIASTPEGELQNTILQHPWLDGQRFDGIDSNLNPEPPLNTAARREFDNERREQEMEKQLRLGNMPQFTSAPKPSPK